MNARTDSYGFHKKNPCAPTETAYAFENIAKRNQNEFTVRTGATGPVGIRNTTVIVP